MVRFQITLDHAEASALARWAHDEMREMRDQARLLVRQGLERAGKVPTSPPPELALTSEPAHAHGTQA